MNNSDLFQVLRSRIASGDHLNEDELAQFEAFGGGPGDTEVRTAVHTCPDCGQKFAGEQDFGAHHRATHLAPPDAPADFDFKMVIDDGKALVYDGFGSDEDAVAFARAAFAHQAGEAVVWREARRDLRRMTRVVSRRPTIAVATPRERRPRRHARASRSDDPSSEPDDEPHPGKCSECDRLLADKRAKTCSDACRKARQRRLAAETSSAEALIVREIVSPPLTASEVAAVVDRFHAGSSEAMNDLLDAVARADKSRHFGAAGFNTREARLLLGVLRCEKARSRVRSEQSREALDALTAQYEEHRLAVASAEHQQRAGRERPSVTVRVDAPAQLHAACLGTHPETTKAAA